MGSSSKWFNSSDKVSTCSRLSQVSSSFWTFFVGVLNNCLRRPFFGAGDSFVSDEANELLFIELLRLVLLLLLLLLELGLSLMLFVGVFWLAADDVLGWAEATHINGTEEALDFIDNNAVTASISLFLQIKTCLAFLYLKKVWHICKYWLFYWNSFKFFGYIFLFKL